MPLLLSGELHQDVGLLVLRLHPLHLRLAHRVRRRQHHLQESWTDETIFGTMTIARFDTHFHVSSVRN